MCKRNGSPQLVLQVLRKIKSTYPSLRLHGFGLKLQALAVPEIQDLLYSADSAAATLAGGRGSKKYCGLDGHSQHDPISAIKYEMRIYEAYLRNCITTQQEDACYKHLEHLQQSINRLKRRPTKRSNCSDARRLS